MLFLGCETPTPLDLVTGFPSDQKSTHCNYGEFVQQVKQSATEAYEIARKHLRRNAERHKNTYDIRVCNQQLKELETGSGTIICDVSHISRPNGRSETVLWRHICIVALVSARSSGRTGCRADSASFNGAGVGWRCLAARTSWRSPSTTITSACPPQVIWRSVCQLRWHLAPSPTREGPSTSGIPAWVYLTWSELHPGHSSGMVLTSRVIWAL